LSHRNFPAQDKTIINYFLKESFHMNIRFQVIKGFALAGVLASGLISTGSAASAQSTTAVTTSANVTSVSMSTIDPKADRQAALEQENADARRVEFRNLGTSL
jgi:hypothetical protein